MDFKIRCRRNGNCSYWTELLLLQILVLLIFFDIIQAKFDDNQLQRRGPEKGIENIASHSCIHDEIIEQRRKRPGSKVYSVTPQVYHQATEPEPLHRKGRALLEISEVSGFSKNVKQPIRIYLNYDAVGHSPARDCRNVGDIVKLGEPPAASNLGTPTCNPHNDPPISGDCWYNCTSDDIAGEDKRHRLRRALGQTADWFRRALAVEPVRGNLRLSGYSACSH